MKIDAHQHFWRYTPEAFGWIDAEMQAIRRDFLPADLRPEIRAAGIDGVIAVQARQTLEETRWLLGLAAEHAFINGVVGWVPLASPDAEAALERFAGEDALVGVRHVLHDEPDDDYMLRADFNRGIDLLQHYGLVYDVLIFPRHLPQTIDFVDRHPNQIFVIDHLAKPRVEEGAMQPWKDRMSRLAERAHCHCKVSGLVTEAGWEAWTKAQLRPYWDAVFETFGPERLLFGSDWPVCRLASGYDRWYRTVERFLAPLSDDEQAAILGGTAARAYRL